jgi:aminopeptidase N
VDPTLENFFEHWVYSTGIPSLELRYTVTGKAPNLKLSATVTQTGTSDDMSVDVPVSIQTGRETLTRWIRTGSEPASFTLALRQKPQKVELDPAGSVLAVRK